MVHRSPVFGYVFNKNSVDPAYLIYLIDIANPGADCRYAENLSQRAMTQGPEAELPFIIQQFYHVLVEYNETVWPVQFLIIELALAAISVVLAPCRWSGRAASAILALLWAWMAMVYHLVVVARINPAAYACAH